MHCLSKRMNNDVYFFQVAGMFITYFVLLVQFKPSEDTTIQINEIAAIKQLLQNLTDLVSANNSVIA